MLGLWCQKVDEEKATPLSPVEMLPSPQGQSQNNQAQSSIPSGQVGFNFSWEIGNRKAQIFSVRGSTIYMIHFVIHFAGIPGSDPKSNWLRSSQPQARKLDPDISPSEVNTSTNLLWLNL